MKSYLESAIWCQNFIIFCPAVTEILQNTDRQQNRYGKPKFRESFSLRYVIRREGFPNKFRFSMPRLRYVSVFYNISATTWTESDENF